MNDSWRRKREKDKLIDWGMFGMIREEEVWSSEHGTDSSLSRSLFCEAIGWLNANYASFKEKKAVKQQSIKIPTIFSLCPKNDKDVER